MRRLATIRRIEEIKEIPGADRIEAYRVDGWWCVDSKGKYQVGELALYLECDSWVPTKLAPFLSNGHEPRNYNGVDGERLRTVKLRKQLSQGLLISLDGLLAVHGIEASEEGKKVFTEGLDLTEQLEVQKWERPINAQLQGLCRGNFPNFIRKTDQERCQNLKHELAEAAECGDEFEVTAKINGSSMTVYYQVVARLPEAIRGEEVIVGELGVCSRNMELKLEGNDENSFIKVAKSSGLLDALQRYGRSIAVQGELFGEGIQGNDEGMVGQHFAAFDVFDIQNQSYLSPSERYMVMNELTNYGYNGCHVKILSTDFQIGSCSIDDLLILAEGTNLAGNEQEGLVFKRLDGGFSFKAISNRFLLKGGD